jgi:hypothetical protein
MAEKIENLGSQTGNPEIDRTTDETLESIMGVMAQLGYVIDEGQAREIAAGSNEELLQLWRELKDSGDELERSSEKLDACYPPHRLGIFS